MSVKDEHTGRRLAVALLKSILILPGTALVYVPAIILITTAGTGWGASPAGFGEPAFWLGLALALCGLSLAIWTVTDFIRVGRGTPAPWHPPTRLVVRGPYRHLRNPMITGVFLMLAAEALVLRSAGIAAWLAVFMAANFVYIPLVEEPGLEKRFGPDYRRYRENVPRWLPRPTAWGGT